jgi:hypothetical protein
MKYIINTSFINYDPFLFNNPNGTFELPDGAIILRCYSGRRDSNDGLLIVWGCPIKEHTLPTKERK